MNQFICLDEDTMDCYDPNEYREHRQPVSVPVNFRTHTRRSFLNECINQIYLMSNWNPPNESTSAENDKNVICSILDTVLTPPKLDPYFAAIERVKRRLFYDTTQTARKMAKPERKQHQLIECEYFKPQRHILGVRKLRRNLIAQEQEERNGEWLHRERTLANERLLEASVRSMLYLKALVSAVPFE